MDDHQLRAGGGAIFAALREELNRHPTGLSALDLAQKTMGRGFSKSDVQRAIRRAIDKGEVGVGADLELRVTESA